ncbi:Cytochrome b5 [Cardamine amara subsp. amara]|uniref:Cytochrome b5 n=1 Tax=Cardamine amara subsp. amara TaxID=228776 RepID=A0ABD1AKY1_CARAN
MYDVTPFMDVHPGGNEILLSSTGKDATNDFENVGHSDTARDMMEKYITLVRSIHLVFQQEGHMLHHINSLQPRQDTRIHCQE